MSNLIWTILNRIYRFNYGLLSYRLKRVCFWGSVYGYQEDLRSDLDSLKLLNESMGLCTGYKALGYPAVIQKFVTHDDDFREAVKVLEESEDPLKFVSIIHPHWHYGKVASMLVDADRYLEFKRKLKQQPS